MVDVAVVVLVVAVEAVVVVAEKFSKRIYSIMLFYYVIPHLTLLNLF